MSVIDDYLQSFSTPEREALEHIRQIIKEIVPDAEEVISYGMPGFKYKGKYFGGFNGFKDHLSLFPTSSPVDAYKNQLHDFKLSRGTIQFTLDHPIPDQLIKDMVSYRKSDIDAS